MTTMRISMKKIKEILRLKFESKLTHREIGKSLNISPGTVSTVVNDAKACGITWPIPTELDDQRLEIMIYGDKTPQQARHFILPDWSEVFQSLKKHKGTTKQLLWQEYRDAHGKDTYSYSQFCERFRAWLKRQTLSMRQIHLAGDKTLGLVKSLYTFRQKNRKHGDKKKDIMVHYNPFNQEQLRVLF